MSLSKPPAAALTLTQLIFKLTGDGSLRGTMTPDKGFQTSIPSFITKACKYEGISSGRNEWAKIKACAADPKAKFHTEAAAIVAGEPDQNVLFTRRCVFASPRDEALCFCIA